MSSLRLKLSASVPERLSVSESPSTSLIDITPTFVSALATSRTEAVLITGLSLTEETTIETVLEVEEAF